MADRPPFVQWSLAIGRVALLPLSVLLIGCAASQETLSSDAAAERATFRSETIVLAQDFFSRSGLGGGSALNLSARATCRGAGCVPETVTLVFLADGPSELTVADRTVRLLLGATPLREWKDEEADQQITPADRVAGRITAVEIDLDVLQTVASSSVARGTLAGKTFRFDASARTALQRFLDRVTGRRADASSAS
jgi:hypothetical protein